MENKTYRKDYTISESASAWPGNNVMWYKGSIDMDNQHFCSTFLTAESEIDDAIITEQAKQIEKLKAQLIASNITISALLINRNIPTAVGVIKKNEQLLESIE